MKNEIIKFSITDLAITELATKYRDMKITDTASYKLVTAGIGKIRSIRTSVEERRLEYGRSLKKLKAGADGEARRITELLLPIETELKATKQVEDARKEAIRLEKDKLEKERIETIQAKIAAFPPDMSRLPQLLKMTAPEIREMQDALSTIEIDIEIYQEFTPEAIAAKIDKAKLLQEYYISRIHIDAEEKNQQAEAVRLAEKREEQETRQRIEEERLAKIRTEQEVETGRILAEQEKIKVQKHALQKERNRIDHEKAEQIRLDQEKQAQIEADKVAKIEAEKQKQAQIKKEAEEKTAREKTEAEEEARQEALRPDREALELYLSAIQKAFMTIEEPLMKNPAGNIALTQIQANFEKMFNDTLDVIEDM